MHERTDLIIELSGCVIDFDDMLRYFKCSPQPQFWVYIEIGGSVFRAPESNEHKDVFIALRNLDSLGDFSLHQHFIQKKNLALRKLNLETIALRINKETVVAIDPEWDSGLIYDEFFLINFAFPQHEHI